MGTKLKHAAFTAFPIIVALVLVELLIRAFLGPLDFTGDHKNVLIEPHPRYGYFQLANYRGTVNRSGRKVAFSTNSLGLRDAELRDDPGLYTVLAVGDSFTVGWGVDESDAWPSRLETVLNRTDGPGADFQVVNGGVSGYSLRQIRLLTEDLLQATEPELVILGLFTSRYWRLDNPYVLYQGKVVARDRVPRLVPVEGGFFYTSFERDGARRADVWLKQHYYTGAYVLDQAMKLVRKIGRRIEKARRAKAEEGDQRVERKLAGLLAELEGLSAAARGAGAELIVLLVSHQEDDGSFAAVEADYNAVVKRACDHLALTCLDLLQDFIDHARGRPVLKLETDHHWSPAAHDLAARALAKAVLERLP